MNNERTSKRVASIAARLHNKLTGYPDDTPVCINISAYGDNPFPRIATIKELISLCQSLITQRPDKKK